jgi:hypothetical protein
MKTIAATCAVLFGLIVCVLVFGLPMARPLATSLDRFSHSNCLWSTEDGAYAFVADSHAYCYGIEKESNEILRFLIGDYSTAGGGHEVQIYSTGETQLETAFRVSRKRKSLESLELLGAGYAMPVGQYDEIIEAVMEDGTVLRFKKHELPEEFSIKETPVWPDEMLRWIEQQE